MSASMDLLWNLLCLLLWQWNVAFIFGQNAPYTENLLILSPSTPSITHFENDSFIIFCKTVQKDIPTVWRDPKGIARENTKGRVHIEKKAGSLALVFEHISLMDKGNWTCEATAVGFDIKATRKKFELLVNQKISFHKTDEVQSAREGRDATVYCNVQGDPAPIVSWLYNGESISTNKSSKYKRLSDGLFIKNVTQADAGEYTCRAMQITQTFSDSDHITILLRIQHKPHWFFNETSPIQYAYIGGSVNITCDALGEPPPSFKWIHNGKAIVGQNHRIFYSDYGSTLQLQVRNESQFGDYKCKVANELGMLERVIKLRVGPKPPKPVRFQVKRVFSDAMELDIKSQKAPDIEELMQVYGYRVEYMSDNDFLHSGGNWSYAKKREFSFHRGGLLSLLFPGHRFLITNLSSNTTYLMRAASRNLAGLSDWSAVKKFATLASAATSPMMQMNFQLPAILMLLTLIYKNWQQL